MSKIKHIQYETFEMQPYLRPNDITLSSARFHFQARSSMINIQGNFKSQFNSDKIFCQGCLNKNKEEKQSHIYDCYSLSSSEIMQSDDDHQYSQLFCDDLLKQLEVSAILKTRLEIRGKIIKERENKS